MEIEERTDNRTERDVKIEIMIIGIISIGASIFGFMEGSFFNTYIDHVLVMDYIYISIMVSVSATFGLIFLMVFGIFSDNTRSRFGRRRPYLLVGGFVAGTSMILYGFSPNYAWCFILDAIIIGIFSNMFYAAQRPLIPDRVEIEHRGRANGVVAIFGAIGTIAPIVLTLVANEFFSEKRGKATIITQTGHAIILTVGGVSIIAVGLIGFIFLKNLDEKFPPKKKFFEELKETMNFQELKKHGNFFKLIIAMTIYTIGTKIFYPFLFNYVFDLGLSTLLLIIALAVIAPITFLTAFALGKMADKYGRKKLIAPLLCISSIGFIMIPFIYPDTILNAGLLMIAVILVLLGQVGLLVPLTAWQQDLLPDQKRGQFLGILNIIFTTSQIPGAILGGLIADSFGVQWTFAVVPIFFLLSIPFFQLVKETLPDAVEEDIETIEINRKSTNL